MGERQAGRTGGKREEDAGGTTGEILSAGLVWKSVKP